MYYHRSTFGKLRIKGLIGSSAPPALKRCSSQAVKNVKKNTLLGCKICLNAVRGLLIR